MMENNNNDEEQQHAEPTEGDHDVMVRSLDDLGRYSEDTRVNGIINGIHFHNTAVHNVRLLAIEYHRLNLAQEARPKTLSPEKFEEFDKVEYDATMADEDQDVCPICLDSRKADQEIVMLPCTHKYHYECGQDHFMASTKCAVCRHDYNDK